MRRAWLLALLLAGCGGNSSSPSPPAPSPTFAGAVTGPWTVTHGSAPSGAMGAFPQCPSASSCWVSYVEAPVSVALVAGQIYDLTFTISGTDPVFVHDTPSNIADGPATIRLLLTGNGYRAFSNPMLPLQVGNYTLTALLSPANWIVVDTPGNTVDMLPTLLQHISGIGFCFGGGFFACHGVTVSSGNASFEVNSATIR